MSRVTRLSLPLLLLSFVAWPVAPSSAGDAAKAARGIVTALGADSVMINLANDTDVTFRVDATTRIVARGAGTKMRQVKADGASGLTLAEVLPIGGAVEVTYEEINGRRCARRITSIAPLVTSTVDDRAHASGTVALVRADWIAIRTDDGEDIAFRADTNTRVVGPGFGRKTAARGGKVAIAELLTGGDRVRVTYQDNGETMHAETVRLVSRATRSTR
jgi:hypothetical protein